MDKVKFFTLGCKVNQYETQALRELFSAAGFREDNAQPADVYIVNTCTVTQRADRQSRQLINQALRLNPQAKVVVTGCYVQRDAPRILQISPRIQIVPQQKKHQIIDFLKLTPQAQPMANNSSFLPLKITDFQNRQRALVKIQDGCNNFCSFCKVPLVRGRSRSRSLTEIISEVERLLARGFKEIVLTGICLGDYLYQGKDLVDLLSCLERIDGQFRLRLSSLEPEHLNDRLLAWMASSRKLCAHLHIPLQSGDNTILKKMHRRYTREDYLGLVAKIKQRMKDVALSCDVLVGFPGETEINFRNTLHCLKEILPLRTHIFSFSPRPGTAAFCLSRRIPPPLVKERVKRLQEVAAQCSWQFRQGFLGETLTVLLESQPERQSGLFCGYTQNYIRVIVEDAGREDINRLLPVEIKKVEKDFTWARKKKGG